MPATKTFTAQLAALALVAEALGPVPWTNGDWQRLPEAVAAVLDDFEPAERAAERLDGTDELVAVGRGYLMPVALEAALKLREAARLRAEGWSAADFRHGPVTVAGPASGAGGERRRSPRPPTSMSSRASSRPAGADRAAARRRPAGGPAYPGELAEPLRALPATMRA